MTVSFFGNAFELWAGLAMSSMFRANDRINLYPAAPIVVPIANLSFVVALILSTLFGMGAITRRKLGAIFLSALAIVILGQAA